MLTEDIIRADTTDTTVRRATRLRAKVESVGGNCEFSTAKRYGYSHIGVTRDWWHVNQLITQNWRTT
jgi:hypothetical protein